MTRYFLLIAGSKGWSNYRHQADVMALSTLLHSDPNNNVITMMTDDIVNHPSNPAPGKMFNTETLYDTNTLPRYCTHKPTSIYNFNFGSSSNLITKSKPSSFINCSPELYDNKYNIYHNEYINSTNVTFQSMKQLMSKNKFTKNDIVTIYYNDHGAPGLLCSPKNTDFFADDIENYLKELSHQVGKILFIIESCYSGSIAKYISIPNVFTISAANAIQSSYSTKWSNELNTFVTNLFTLNFINFINDLDNQNLTILDLVNYLASHTLRSTVTAYGDNHFSKSLTKYKISEVFGSLSPIPRDPNDEEHNEITNNKSMSPTEYLNEMTTYYNYDSKYINQFSYTYKQWKNIKGTDDQIMYNLALDFRSNITKFEEYKLINHEIIPDDYKCMKELTTTYIRKCGPFTDYGYTYLLPFFTNLCYDYKHESVWDNYYQSKIKQAKNIIVSTCRYNKHE